MKNVENIFFVRKMAIAHMCSTNLVENFFGGYSNVYLYFVFKKLFHQITPYLIFLGGARQFVTEKKQQDETQYYFNTQIIDSKVMWLALNNAYGRQPLGRREPDLKVNQSMELIYFISTPHLL